MGKFDSNISRDNSGFYVGKNWKRDHKSTQPQGQRVNEFRDDEAVYVVPGGTFFILNGV